MALLRRVFRSRPGSRRCRIVSLGLSVAVVSFSAWLIVFGVPADYLTVRLYGDPAFLREKLYEWGSLAPLAFITIQALQVIIAPIPGDVTGLLGGFVFGQWLGFVYSTTGLTVGSLFAFWVGRRFGVPVVQRLIRRRALAQTRFIVEGSSIVCFVIYVIPGFPKDIACYFFGASPMPFWVFPVVSTAGRRYRARSCPVIDRTLRR